MRYHHFGVAVRSDVRFSVPFRDCRHFCLETTITESFVDASFVFWSFRGNTGESSVTKLAVMHQLFDALCGGQCEINHFNKTFYQ